MLHSGTNTAKGFYLIKVRIKSICYLIKVKFHFSFFYYSGIKVVVNPFTGQYFPIYLYEHFTRKR